MIAKELKSTKLYREYSLEIPHEEIDIEVEKVQKDLISDRDLEKLQNSLETQFVNRNSSVEGIANSLADYYTFMVIQA